MRVNHLSSAAGPLWGGRDADWDDGGRLGGGCEAVSGLPLAAGRQGPQRPQVPRGAALFHGPLTWRALPAEFGNWNSIWKRFWRLSQAGVFEALFEALAANSQTAHLVQMFDSTTVRAHVSAAGARRDGEKGGPRARPSAARAGASRPRSTSRSISTACRSPST